MSTGPHAAPKSNVADALSEGGDFIPATFHTIYRDVFHAA